MSYTTKRTFCEFLFFYRCLFFGVTLSSFFMYVWLYLPNEREYEYEWSESVLNKSTLHHITCACRFNIILMRHAHSLNTHNINMKRAKIAHEHTQCHYTDP